MSGGALISKVVRTLVYIAGTVHSVLMKGSVPTLVVILYTFLYYGQDYHDIKETRIWYIYI